MNCSRGTAFWSEAALWRRTNCGLCGGRFVAEHAPCAAARDIHNERRRRTPRHCRWGLHVDGGNFLALKSLDARDRGAGQRCRHRRVRTHVYLRPMSARQRLARLEYERRHRRTHALAGGGHGAVKQIDRYGPAPKYFGAVIPGLRLFRFQVQEAKNHADISRTRARVAAMPDRAGVQHPHGARHREFVQHVRRVLGFRLR